MKITIPALKKYLKKNLDKTFYPRDPWSCPVAKYLLDKTGDLWSVGPEDYGLSGYSHNYVHYHTPPDVSELIRAVDARFRTRSLAAGGDAPVPITGAEALEILETL